MFLEWASIAYFQKLQGGGMDRGMENLLVLLYITLAIVLLFLTAVSNTQKLLTDSIFVVGRRTVVDSFMVSITSGDDIS